MFERKSVMTYRFSPLIFRSYLISVFFVEISSCYQTKNMLRGLKMFIITELGREKTKYIDDQMRMHVFEVIG
jgi:hypothetical protein